MLDRLRTWYGRRLPDHVILPPVAPAPAPAAGPGVAWPSARIALAEQLWGEGFLLPGGAEEVLRLARPLGLSAASTLLLIGAGIGGPAHRIAAELGVWVAGFEADADLAALAATRGRTAGLARRAAVSRWNPAAPAFGRRRCHHALLIEPLRHGPAGSVLASAARAVRADGQIALVDLAATEALDAADPDVAAWLRLERRAGLPETEATITAVLADLGYDVRVAEDISARHATLAMRGWRERLDGLDKQRETPAGMALLVAEAELWLRRLRLLRRGRLRLVRWLAVGSAGGSG